MLVGSLLFYVFSYISDGGELSFIVSDRAL